MAIYVKDGRVDSDSREDHRRVRPARPVPRLHRTAHRQGSRREDDRPREGADQRGRRTTRPRCRALLNLALNQQLFAAGQDLVRFRTMKYEFSRQGQKFRADLPVGNDVREAKLDFFGVNAAQARVRERRRLRRRPRRRPRRQHPDHAEGLGRCRARPARVGVRLVGSRSSSSTARPGFPTSKASCRRRARKASPSTVTARFR